VDHFNIVDEVDGQESFRAALLADEDYLAHVDRMNRLAYEQVVTHLEPLVTAHHRSTTMHYILALNPMAAKNGLRHDLSMFFYHFDWTVTFPPYVTRFLDRTRCSLHSTDEAARTLGRRGRQIILAMQNVERLKKRGPKPDSTRQWREDVVDKLWDDYRIGKDNPLIEKCVQDIARRCSISDPDRSRTIRTLLTRCNKSRLPGLDGWRKGKRDLRRYLNRMDL
jgi:hypothetical protein